MRLLLNLLLLFLPCYLFAQTYNFPGAEWRTYAVTASTVEQLLTGTLQIDELPDPGDPLPAGTPRTDLPPGHYLRVKLSGEEATYDYFSTYDYAVKVAEHRGKFQLRLYDPEGQPRPDAVVTADGKPVPYHKKHQAFRRRDWRIDHLRIAVGGDTLFYRIDESIRQSRFRNDVNHLLNNRPAYYLLTPYRFTRSSYHYLKRGIGQGNWRWYRYPFQRPIQQLINPPKPITGYVATNQPRYRPGDTVRISAYLAKPKGRPLYADSISMTIRQQGNYKPVLRRKIGRTEPGRYVFNFPIPAGWVLDKRYTISFDRPGIMRREVEPRISFRLEDYELAEYQLAVTASQDARLPGSAWLDVTAKDINGLTLPEGELRVTVLVDRFAGSIDTTTLVLPDTLYVYTEGTDNRRERRITLPDSLFPAGHSLMVRVKTQLTGPSGEYKERVVSMKVDRRYPVIPRLRLNRDSLLLSLAPASAPKKATLLTISPGLDTVRTTVTLPHRLRIDHQQLRYQLRYGPQTVGQQLSELRPTVGSPVRWSRDTLTISFPNLHQQPLRWELWAGTQVRGNGEGAGAVYRQPGFTPGETLELSYRYLAGGKWRHERQTLTVPDYRLQTDHPKVLNLALTQPAEVRPGQTVRVALQATDQRGRPARRLRLTAGAYNARFGNTPTTTPTYLSKSRRERQRQGYRKQAPNLSYTVTPPAWLVHGFGKDSLLAYRLRYPTPEFRQLRDLDTLMPKDVPGAHFAPFVVRKNKLQTVRMVFADDRLIYFYHPNITTPYSIPLDGGWHEITLRTNNYSYQKRLHFPARRQLVLSFDADRWVSAGWSRREVKRPTNDEIGALHNRLFAVTSMKSGQTLQFHTPPYRTVQSGVSSRQSGWSPLGLVLPEKAITFRENWSKPVRLAFEPRAAYRITPGRDRLYPLSWSSLETELKRKYTTSPRAPELPRYQWRVLPKVKPQPLRVKRLPRRQPSEVTSRVQFTRLPESLGQVIISPVGDDLYYRADRNAPNKVLAGDYDLIYWFANDSLRYQRVTLPSDSLTLVVFRAEALSPFKKPPPPERYSSSDRRPKLKAKQEIDYKNYDFKGDRISGQVTDETGEPLIGLAIQIVGTTNGTVTDIDGRYTLEVPFGPFELAFSYVGYGSKQIALDSRVHGGGTYNMVMDEMAAQLQEVVVTGYSVPLIEQDYTTASVSVISANELSKLPVRSVNALQGRVAGVSITKEGDQINIRGSRSDAVDFYVDGEASTTTLPPVNLRQTFADYAAFVPELRTDGDGRAVFDVTFPDDITAWNTFAVGQDRRRRVGFALDRANAFLPLQAQLYLPRFLVEGDKSEATALAINRTDEARRVRLTFSGDGVRAEVADTLLEGSVSSQFPIEAEELTDSLTYRFTLQDLSGQPDGDGEQRSLPVYPKGTEMVSGELLLLTERVTTLPDSFVRPERGPVTLRMPGNRLGQLLKDIDHLVSYPYACVEQTASRIIGLLALRSIREAEGKVFNRETEISKMVARLEKLRRPDGGYGWWGGSGRSTPWITQHVYLALARAEAAGYRVGDLAPLRRYLFSVAPELSHREQLRIALTLAEEGKPPTAEEISRLDILAAPNDYQLLAITRLHQLRGDTIDTQRLLDSSSRHAVIGRYWGERRFRFFREPVNDRLACGLLAQRIFSDAGMGDVADEVVNYLLGQTPSTHRPGAEPLLGTNTLESAKLVASLLPYLLEDDPTLAPPSVSLATEQREVLAKDFPFEVQLEPREISSLTLERSGSGPMPVTVFQRWFERQPTPTANGFKLSSRFVDARDRPLRQLTKGVTAYLEVTVDVKADADYVLIEAPIPAGCSYQARGEAKGPFAVHREYRRDRVAIFCDRLPAGRYTYKVALAPRFSGEYTVNPARAEMQYVPVVFGNGALERVRVE